MSKNFLNIFEFFLLEFFPPTKTFKPFCKRHPVSVILSLRENRLPCIVNHYQKWSSTLKVVEDRFNQCCLFLHFKETYLGHISSSCQSIIMLLYKKHGLRAINVTL